MLLKSELRWLGMYKCIEGETELLHVWYLRLEAFKLKYLYLSELNCEAIWPLKMRMHLYPIILTDYSFLCSICGNGYPCFEISAVNADKPPLSVSQIKDRVKQFEKVGESVCLSSCSWFGATVYVIFSGCGLNMGGILD